MLSFQYGISSLYILLMFWKSLSDWDKSFSKILTVFLVELEVEVSSSFNFSSIFEINGVLAYGSSNLFERLILNKGFAISSKKFGLSFLVSLISKFSIFLLMNQRLVF